MTRTEILSETRDHRWMDVEPESQSSGAMAGLTAAETAEFMALDARNFVDENGNPFPWPWDVTGEAKGRWLALYEKHESALNMARRARFSSGAKTSR